MPGCRSLLETELFLGEEGLRRCSCFKQDPTTPEWLVKSINAATDFFLPYLSKIGHPITIAPFSNINLL